MNCTATVDSDTLAVILVLISAIECRIDTDAAVLGFRADLRCRGAEAMIAGGPDLAEALMRAVAEGDPA